MNEIEFLKLMNRDLDNHKKVIEQRIKKLEKNERKDML